MVRKYEQVDQEERALLQNQNRYGLPRRKRAQDYGRYDSEAPSLQNRQDALKATRIHVYTNGTQYQGEAGLHFSYNRKHFPCMESLLGFMTEKIRTKIAVRYLFSWPSGEEIKLIEDIDDDQTLFVASDNRKLNIKRDYGNVKYGSDRYEGGGSTAFSERYGRKNPSSSTTTGKPSPVSVNSNNSLMTSSRGPIMINLISNTDRGSKQSMFVNPQSGSFEDIMKTVPELINIGRPPVTALYTCRYPHKKVQSISGLTKVVRQYGDTFFACGQEGPPEEVFNVQSPNRSPNRSPTRDTSPMQNGYNHQSPPRRRVQNGTKEYRDEPRGRQYNISERQRRQTRNQPDGEDESPVRGRRNQQGMTPRSKQTPRRNDGDSTTPRRGNNTYRQEDDSDHSRSVTPNEEDMARKIGEMERIKSDLDGDIEY